MGLGHCVSFSCGVCCVGISNVGCIRFIQTPGCMGKEFEILFVVFLVRVVCALLTFEVNKV